MNSLVSYEGDSDESMSGSSSSKALTSKPTTSTIPTKRKTPDVVILDHSVDDDSSVKGMDALTSQGKLSLSKPPGGTTIVKRVKREANKRRSPVLGLDGDELGRPTPSLQRESRPSSSNRSYSSTREEDATPSRIVADAIQEGLSIQDTREPEFEDELQRFRELVRPPPIDGLEDWGIPPPPSEPCDPKLAKRLAHFHDLKRQPNPTHFNDQLNLNRRFKNPHLHAAFVQHVGVDERGTNFPKEMWDPFDVQEDWYADRIAQYQKDESEKKLVNRAPGKRSKIDFTGSSSSTTRQQERNRGSGVSATASQSQGARVLGGGAGASGRKSRYEGAHSQSGYYYKSGGA